MAERLGDVPVAVLEKGKQPGSHLLSGAVVNPRALRRLFGDRYRIDDLPSYGPVHGESVYFLTRRSGAAHPAAADDAQPRQLRSSRSRSSAAGSPSEAEEGGATILPETAAREAARRRTAACVGVRTGDKGRGRDGERARQLRARLRPRRARSRCSPRGRRATSPASRSTASGSAATSPQVWALGVKEVWKVAEAARPRRSTRWAGRCARGAQVPRVRRLVHLPDGRRHGHDRDGRRARLPRRRALGARPAAGAEDAPEDPQDPRGRRARRSGARRRFPRAASTRCRSGCTRPGLLLVRRRRRARQRAGAEGHPLRDRVGPARGRGGVRARCSAARRRATRARVATTTRCARASSGATCTRCATCARCSGAASSSAARSRAR